MQDEGARVSQRASEGSFVQTEFLGRFQACHKHPEMKPAAIELVDGFRHQFGSSARAQSECPSLGSLAAFKQLRAAKQKAPYGSTSAYQGVIFVLQVDRKKAPYDSYSG